jgi:hypothetical protein
MAKVRRCQKIILVAIIVSSRRRQTKILASKISFIDIRIIRERFKVETQFIEN